jgi:hypothetical protein
MKPFISHHAKNMILEKRQFMAQRPHPGEIIEGICRALKVDQNDLLSASQVRFLYEIRCIVSTELYINTNLNAGDIALRLNKDRGTIEKHFRDYWEYCYTHPYPEFIEKAQIAEKAICTRPKIFAEKFVHPPSIQKILAVSH